MTLPPLDAPAYLEGAALEYGPDGMDAVSSQIRTAAPARLEWTSEQPPIPSGIPAGRTPEAPPGQGALRGGEGRLHEIWAGRSWRRRHACNLLRHVPNPAFAVGLARGEADGANQPPDSLARQRGRLFLRLFPDAMGWIRALPHGVGRRRPFARPQRPGAGANVFFVPHRGDGLGVFVRGLPKLFGEIDMRLDRFLQGNTPSNTVSTEQSA